MVVVSYRGYKIIAQGIIPGILSVDQINCSQYGSLDDGKTFPLVLCLTINQKLFI